MGSGSDLLQNSLSVKTCPKPYRLTLPTLPFKGSCEEAGNQSSGSEGGAAGQPWLGRRQGNSALGKIWHIATE